MAGFSGIEEAEGINPGYIILGGFILLLIAMFAYLYVSNKKLAEQGGYNSKKYGKKSKKGKTNWSFGD